MAPYRITFQRRGRGWNPGDTMVGATLVFALGWLTNEAHPVNLD